MKVVILCGGKGTRMGNDELPKALFTIGNRPILWHIMNIYAHYGFSDFILCLGYEGNKIRDYFAKIRNLKITFVDTGLNTNTAGRISRIRNYIKEEDFLATYGDGLADIGLLRLVNFHKSHQKIATITAVKPCSPFGIVGIDSHTNTVTHFEEKPVLDHWINGGFFVFNRKIFNYLDKDDVLEKDTFRRLVRDRQLCAFKHRGFWKCMDTYKDSLELNELWKKNTASWKVW
jgi:glucose-1-phosphate cytidylyltransferase